MSPYIGISSEEHRVIKKAILEALASSVKAQNTASQLSRLKRSKKPAMTGMVTALKESNKELENIKQALPEFKLPKPKVKPAKQARAKARTKYEQELEVIKHRISKLG